MKKSPPFNGARLGEIVVTAVKGYVARAVAEVNARINLLETRIAPGGEPSLAECEALSVTGDVRFEPGVTIRGSVAITNPNPTPAVIKAGTVLDRDMAF